MLPWSFQKNGVFGLSPNSQFWPYLSKAYGNNHTMDISISYKVNKEQLGKADSDKLDFSQSKLIINGYQSPMRNYFVYETLEIPLENYNREKVSNHDLGVMNDPRRSKHGKKKAFMRNRVNSNTNKSENVTPTNWIYSKIERLYNLESQ